MMKMKQFLISDNKFRFTCPDPLSEFSVAQQIALSNEQQVFPNLQNRQSAKIRYSFGIHLGDNVCFLSQ